MSEYLLRTYKPQFAKKCVSIKVPNEGTFKENTGSDQFDKVSQAIKKLISRTLNSAHQ